MSDGRRFAIFWVVTLATLFGPWLLLHAGVSALADGSDVAAVGEAGKRLGSSIDSWYLWGLGAYLAASWFLTPTWDRENVGLFGTSWIDNPFTLEDDWNRSKRTLAFLLVPGKIVWETLSETWKRLGGRRVS